MRIASFVDQQNRNHKDDSRQAEGTNICGVMVRAHPDKLPQVTDELAAMDGVEVHQTDPDGRMVVVVEDTEDEWAGQIITRLATLPGILAATLIYHHCEPGDLDKEHTQ